MKYGLVNDDGTLAADNLDAEPVPGEGQRVVIVPDYYPARAYWTPLNGGGFVDLPAPTLTLSVGRFKLLLTQPERIAIRQAAAGNAEVADFLDLLNGFTEGVTLDDPLLVHALGEMQAAGLLSADRVTQILAGTPPA